MSKLEQALRGITIRKVTEAPESIGHWLTAKKNGKTGFELLGELADQLKVSARVSNDNVCFRFDVNGSLYYMRTPSSGGIVFIVVRDKDPDLLESLDYNADSCEVRVPVGDDRRWKGLLEIALDFTGAPGEWTDLEATFNGRANNDDL